MSLVLNTGKMVVGYIARKILDSGRLNRRKDSSRCCHRNYRRWIYVSLGVGFAAENIFVGGMMGNIVVGLIARKIFVAFIVKKRAVGFVVRTIVVDFVGKTAVGATIGKIAVGFMYLGQDNRWFYDGKYGCWLYRP